MKAILTKGVRYWHTLRYLRSVQIVGRFQYFFRRPEIDCSPAGALRAVAGKWIMPARRGQSMLAERSFCFLNEGHQIASADDWNTWPHFVDSVQAEMYVLLFFSSTAS